MAWSHAPVRVAVAGSFREEVKSAVLRWLSQGEHTGTFMVEKGSVFFSSSIGKRIENQDRTLFVRHIPQSRKWPVVEALVLCDGMGGMVEGATAAELALSSFVAAFSAQKPCSLASHLCQATEAANEDVYRHFGGRGGTTLSAVAASGIGELAGVNVGDSRIYGLMENGDLVQFSKDDTLANILSEIESPRGTGRLGELLQFVGIGKDIVPHVIDLGHPNAVLKCLFLTSDGAHGLDGHVFAEVVKNATSVVEIAKRLTVLADWSGGKDNATVAVWHAPVRKVRGLALAETGALEIWGVQGKYELTTKQDVHSSLKSQDSVSPRGSRRRTSPRSKRPESGEFPITRRSAEGSRKPSNINIDTPETEAAPRKDNLVDNRPQLEIEVLEG